METMFVRELEAYFPNILKKIEKGNRISILNDKTRKPLAMIVPVEKKPAKRRIGILDGKVKIEFKDNFEMTTEELLEIQ